MENNAGKILRAIRKYYGINQIPFSEELGVRQATLSRIESGKLELSAHQWVSIVDKYDLDARCLTSGKIEQLEPIKINVHNNDQYGNFRISNKYMHLRGSTVRTVYPFIKFMENKIGYNATEEFLKSLNVDPDYFVIQNLPINIKIIEDIFDFLEKRSLISVKKYKEILEIVKPSDAHSYFLKSIGETGDPDNNFKKLTKFVGQHYEINSKYIFEGDKGCFIKARDNSHLNELDLKDEFNKFRSLYNLSHFNKISPLLFSNRKFDLVSQHGGWDLVVAS
jgi:transcriptional regulator with XRE-family HTH domain